MPRAVYAAPWLLFCSVIHVVAVPYGTPHASAADRRLPVRLHSAITRSRFDVDLYFQFRPSAKAMPYVRAAFLIEPMLRPVASIAWRGVRPAITPSSRVVQYLAPKCPPARRTPPASRCTPDPCRPPAHTPVDPMARTSTGRTSAGR